MNKITVLEASEQNSSLVVFTPQMLEDMGIDRSELKNAQYFMVTGDEVEPVPGVYKVKLLTEFNIFAYLIMELDLEELEE